MDAQSNDRRHVDSFKIWCWKRIHAYPMDSKTTRPSSICLQRVLDYFGHIANKDGGNLKQMVITGNIEGRRPRRGHPMCWTKQLWTEKFMRPYTQAMTVAVDVTSSKER